MLRQLQQRLLGPAESRSDRVRRLSRAWLLVVSSLIAGSVAFTFVRLRARIAEYFDERTEQLVSAIDAQLDLIDSDYQRQTSADLNLAFLAISGDTASSSRLSVEEKKSMLRFFGELDVNSRKKIDVFLDILKKDMGAEATLFALDESGFVRVATTLQTDSGGSMEG